ncbi:MAG: hypothetical protein V4649_06700 [Bacteroidota bacterium]
MSQNDQNRLHLELQVDNRPYVVDAERCSYNDELQYRVKVNGSDEVLFVFDRDLGHYHASGNDGAMVPENVAEAIGNQLNRDSLDRQRGR